jgi:hypothetical protein
MMRSTLLLFWLSITFFTVVVFGQIPETMNYQGVLTQPSGQPVPNGNYDITFRLYDSDAGGTLLWNETQPVDVENGIFNVILGDVTPLALDFDAPYWLSIQVAPDPELTPRIELTGVPYSFSSASTEGIQHRPVDPGSPTNGQVLKWDGASWSPADDNAGSSVWATSGDDIYNTNIGSVGIGINSPTRTLHMNDEGSSYLHITNTATGSGTNNGMLFGLQSTGNTLLQNFFGGSIGTVTPTARFNVFDDVTGTNTQMVEFFHNTAGGLSRMINFNRDVDVQSANDILQIAVGTGSSDTFQFVEFERDGVKFKVEGDGDVFADGIYTGPADFSEMIAVSIGAYTVEAGDVLVIDPNDTRTVKKSIESRSTLVAGIYSTSPGFLGSERDWDKIVGDETGTYTMEEMASMYNEVPVAVVGIVPCKVSTENGSIQAGDLLVTSSTPGYAMKDANPKVGTVLGKALESFSGGLGVIKVLVTLH